MELSSLSTLPSSASASLSPPHSNSSISLTSLPALNQQQTAEATGTASDKNNSNLIMIRIYCKERPPVGIPVIEHLELNISPLMINLTNRFYRTMIKFFFFDLQSSQSAGQIQKFAAGSSMSSAAPFQRSTTLPKHHSYTLSSTNEEQSLNALLNINLSTFDLQFI